jgi:hypothetical protein
MPAAKGFERITPPGRVIVDDIDKMQLNNVIPYCLSNTTAQSCADLITLSEVLSYLIRWFACRSKVIRFFVLGFLCY